MNKRGQVAIFVIIALVIVAALIVFLLYPKLNPARSGEFTPQGYLKSCLEPEVKNAAKNIAEHGGVANPDAFIIFNDSKVQYLCYTSENYKTCFVQQPRIIAKFEEEMNKALKAKAVSCMQGLKAEYEKRGYSVSSSGAVLNTSIILGNVRMEIDAPITVTRDSTQTYRQFTVDIPSNIYDLLSIATNIVQFESVYGDSETTLYIQYYPNLKINKIDKGNGDTVYIISDVITKERFIFASRSLPWPPGYGLS